MFDQEGSVPVFVYLKENGIKMCLLMMEGYYAARDKLDKYCVCAILISLL